MYSNEEFEQAKHDSFMEGFYSGTKQATDVIFDVVGIVAFLSSIVIVALASVEGNIIWIIISILLAAVNYYFLAIYPKKKLKENRLLKE